MRRIYAITTPKPTPADMSAAQSAGASEIIQIPCPALPGLVPGFQTVRETADPPADAPSAQMLALGNLAALRWRKTQSLAYTINGTPYTLPCDTEAATNVLGAIIGLQLASSTGPISWKVAPTTFVPLSLTDLIALGQAMRAHVQACYVNEATLAAQIAAAQTAGAALAVDTSQGWPT